MDLKPTFEHYYPEGVKGGECAAFAEKLFEFGPVGDSLASKLAYVKKYGSTVITDIQVGDVVLTDDSKVNGHLFIVNCDMGNAWRVTESNFNLDKIVHHTRLVSKNSLHLKGHLRPPLSVPIINPTPKNMNILLIKHKIPNDARFNAVVDYALNWFKQITNGQFVPVVSIVDRSLYPFMAISGQSIGGANNVPANIFYIDPQEVIKCATPIQDANDKKYQIISLCADYDEIQPRPTYDEAFPILTDGFTISEIGFLKTDQDQFIPVKADFLVHEWLHNFYFILQQKGVSITDDVHQHSGLSDPRPQANFSDIVNNKLKPYWSLLTGTAQGELMPQIKSQAKGPSRRIILEAADLNEWKVLCKVYGKNPDKPEENVKDV